MAIMVPEERGLVQGGWGSKLTDTHTTPKHNLGTIRHESGGRSYVYVQAAAALTIGQAVTQKITDVVADNSVQTNLSAGDPGLATTDTAFLFDTLGSALPAMTTTANICQGWFATVNMDNVTRQGDTYRIVSHTTTRINLDRTLDNVLVDNDVVTIWSPWYVTTTGAVTESVTGIALGTVAALSYCWVQYKGLCPQASYRTVAGDNPNKVKAATGDNTTLLGASGTTGALTPLITTTTAATAAQLNALTKACATLAVPLASGNAGTRLVPVYLNCNTFGRA